MINIDKLSFWERDQYFAGVDVTVVGAGIVGLTTAIFLKRAEPKMKVLVLERGVLPAGASTKNAGFACFGSISELAADLSTMTRPELLALVNARYQGLLELRALLGDTAIGFEPVGGFEVFLDSEQNALSNALNAMDGLNRDLHQMCGLQNTYTQATAQVGAMGFARVIGMIRNAHEGSIDTGLMFASLYRMAVMEGVQILTSVGVSGLIDTGTAVEVALSDGGCFLTRHVHVATNGFAAQLLTELDVRPARAQVLITKPLPDLPFQGTFHLDGGYYYFRNVGNCVLLGGGRNMDKLGETTLSQEVTPAIQAKLEQLLREVILPNRMWEVEHRWAGTMGLGQSKDVILRSIGPRTTCSVRMGGMGIALGTSVGKRAVALVLGRG